MNGSGLVDRDDVLDRLRSNGAPAEMVYWCEREVPEGTQLAHPDGMQRYIRDLPRRR